MTTSLSERLHDLAGRTDRALDRILPPEESAPAALHRAMRYSVFAGGKRVRPALCMLAAEALHVPLEVSVEPAAALELIHTYSLVHDDLPAMDDDDFRRGKPSCHRAFGEATAILAGDALQTLAFEVLATFPEGPEHALTRSRAAAIVASAAGASGMVGGQQMDLDSEGSRGDLGTLSGIHERKTCALIRASVMLGAVLGRADGETAKALQTYGSRIGIAFQITDDVLDVSGDPAILGKTPGKDARAGKLTYPALLGIEESRRRARDLSRQAEEAVASLMPGSSFLVDMARFIVERMH